MLSFIVRRILASILTLVAASFLMYVLAAYSKNPLDELLASNSPNKEALILQMTAALDLDVPPPLRWVYWLGGAARCIVPFAGCDLGLNMSYTPVTTLLPTAMVATIQLVTAATILAIVLGVVVGIVTALRQNSGFDLLVTFFSFFLYSLPSFLVAVLLKQFVAIGFNNFLQKDATITPVWIVLIALISALIWQMLIGGELRRRVTVFLVSGLATGAMLAFMSATNWFLQPGLGPVGLLILIAGTVILVTLISSGFANRRALLGAVIAGAIAYILYFALQGLFAVSTIGTIAILGIATIVVCIIIGYIIGGPDRNQVIRGTILTGLFSSAFVLLDRFMQAWPAYLANERIKGRPIATVGASTTNFSSDFWGTGIDTVMHLMLPTISLLLISFAGYTRYARAGTLEVLNQDYIRTARAKGLPERTVVMRHAFRNTLIPLTTLVATDVGALLGGAVITERVFAIAGMGALFSSSLGRGDLNPVMGYFLVIAIMAILFNFLADLSYAVLDPRVRVK